MSTEKEGGGRGLGQGLLGEIRELILDIICEDSKKQALQMGESEIEIGNKRGLCPGTKGKGLVTGAAGTCGADPPRSLCFPAGGTQA